MKKVSLGMILSLIAIVVLVGSALAEANVLPGSGWYSAEQIQNVGSSAATIDITAFDSQSTLQYSLSDSINPGASKNYLPNAFTGMPQGFQGSAIVSSNVEIRAIVNVTNRYNAALGLGDQSSISPAAGQYQGMNAPANIINFPLVKNDYFGKTTTFFVQNAGTVGATATATFKLPSGTYTYVTPLIGVGQMVVFTANDARDGSSNPPPTGNTVIGSLTVSSGQVLAGTVLEHKTAEVHATVLQASRAFTVADYDTKVFVPTNKNDYFGRFTGLQVQNVSGGPININVTYNGSSGTCVGGTFADSTTNLADGASFNFVSTVLPSGCFAAATVQATGNIVAIINESYNAPYLASHPTRSQESATFNVIPNNAATNVISLPLYKEDSYSKATGISLQNVGSVKATNVVLTFKGPTGTYVTNPLSINAGASIVILDVRNQPASYFNGAAMTPAVLGCTNSVTACGNNGLLGVIVTSDQPVIAIANESTYPLANPRVSQDKSGYEGFNLLTAP